MDEAKQIIVVRKDLNMPIGKVGAQTGHATMKAILNLFETVDNNDGTITLSLNLDKNSALYQWLMNQFVKIVVGVDSEDELLNLYSKAAEQGFIHSLITDNGRTIFNNKPTNTCIAIGPDFSSKIDLLTRNLKLLK